jgi:polysaccharide biosynthesis/export protein
LQAISPRQTTLIACKRAPTIEWFRLSVFVLCTVLPLLAEGANPPAMPTGSNPETAYALTTTDKLNISVFQEEDLNVVTRVDAKGSVNLKLVGDVVISGMSVSDAQKAIETAYKDGRFLRNPQVTIYVEEYAPREVTVYGMVKNPGRVSLPVESPMNLVDLIGKVGGFTDTAKGNAVTVTRIGPDGRRTVIGPIDVEALNKGKNKGSSGENILRMIPGDIVNVPQKIF